MSTFEMIVYPIAALVLAIYGGLMLAEWSANRKFIKELKKLNNGADNI